MGLKWSLDQISGAAGRISEAADRISGAADVGSERLGLDEQEPARGPPPYTVSVAPVIFLVTNTLYDRRHPKILILILATRLVLCRVTLFYIIFF